MSWQTENVTHEKPDPIQWDSDLFLLVLFDESCPGGFWIVRGSYPSSDPSGAFQLYALVRNVVASRGYYYALIMSSF